MSRGSRRVLIGLAGAFIAAALAACGGPSAPKPPPPGSPPPGAPAGQGAAAAAPGQPGAETAPATPVNPRFQMLKPYFAQYLKKSFESKVNLFKSNLAQFAPRVEVEEKTVAVVPSEPKTPLEFFDAESYQLQVIMSGTAQPKALVSDSRGKSYIVTVGTKIGTRGGKVASITSTEVRIEEPGRKPIIKMLELQSAVLEKELQDFLEF